MRRVVLGICWRSKHIIRELMQQEGRKAGSLKTAGLTKKKCRVRLGTHSLARYFFVILPSESSSRPVAPYNLQNSPTLQFGILRNYNYNWKIKSYME